MREEVEREWKRNKKGREGKGGEEKMKRLKERGRE